MTTMKKTYIKPEIEVFTMKPVNLLIVSAGLDETDNTLTWDEEEGDAAEAF